MNLKQMVGIEAAKYVEDGMIVGLGTGSTAKFMVDRNWSSRKRRRIVNRRGYYFKRNRETSLGLGHSFKKY